MKTINEVKQLKEAIEKQLKELPDYSIFGDDNSEEKERMQDQINDLELIIVGRIPKTDEIKSWFVGKDDYFMSDYLK